METMIEQYGHLLLVGEGNFSFSQTILKQLKRDIEMIATCYEDQESIFSRFEGAQQNVNNLEKMGVTVLYEVDATKLHQHPSLATREFDCIIFQFPHVGGKGNIEKNRQLLKGFFMSASELLSENGAVAVTLCNGQGGTPSDSPQRERQNSWQIVSMATFADLILTQTKSFDSSECKLYQSTGYRGQDKCFRTSGAVVHFFQRSDKLPSSVHYKTERLKRIRSLRDKTYEDVRKRLFDSWRTDSSSLDFLPADNCSMEENRPADQARDPDNTGDITHYTHNQRCSCDHCCGSNNNSLATSDIPIDHCLCYSLTRVSKHSHSWTLVLVHEVCAVNSLSYPLKHYLVVNVSRHHGSAQENEKNKFLDAIVMSTGLQSPTASHLEGIDNHGMNCCIKNKMMCIEQGTLSNIGFVVPISFSIYNTETSFVGAVCLEHIVMNKYGLEDTRLLWSLDVRWWTLLSSQDSDSGCRPVTPFSLYPPSYVHDLSFWSNSDFGESSFFSLVRQVAGDYIYEVNLLETYHLNDDRESKCYRMVYQSCDKSLTKDNASSIQTKIRAAIEAELGLIPR